MKPSKVDQTVALRCVPNTFLELLFQPQCTKRFRNPTESVWVMVEMLTKHQCLDLPSLKGKPFPDRTENDTVFTFVFFVLGWWPVIISITSADVMDK